MSGFQGVVRWLGPSVALLVFLMWLNGSNDQGLWQTNFHMAVAWLYGVLSGGLWERWRDYRPPKDLPKIRIWWGPGKIQRALDEHWGEKVPPGVLPKLDERLGR